MSLELELGVSEDDTVGLDDADGALRMLSTGGEDNLWLLVGKNVFQILTGLFIGLSLGYSMKVFNMFNPAKTLYIKFVLLVLICVFTPIVAHLSEFHESKYIGIIFFGYMCY